MTEMAFIPAEFWWLGLTGLLMALISLPYVVDRIATSGFRRTLGNPQENAIPGSRWAERLKAAHYNSVENLAVFGPLVVAVVVTGLANPMTELAAAAFALSRIVYVIVYALGIPVLRTLAFLVGWIAIVYLTLRLLGLA